VSTARSKRPLKRPEVVFKFPLQLCFLAAFKIFATTRRSWLHNRNILSALCYRYELACILPQTTPGDERIMKTVSRHRLQLNVAEPLLLRCLQKLSRDLGTRNSFIVGGQRHWHTVLQISGERML